MTRGALKDQPPSSAAQIYVLQRRRRWWQTIARDVELDPSRSSRRALVNAAERYPPEVIASNPWPCDFQRDLQRRLRGRRLDKVLAIAALWALREEELITLHVVDSDPRRRRDAWQDRYEVLISSSEDVVVPEPPTAERHPERWWNRWLGPSDEVDRIERGAAILGAHDIGRGLLEQRLLAAVRDRELASPLGPSPRQRTELDLSLVSEEDRAVLEFEPLIGRATWPDVAAALCAPGVQQLAALEVDGLGLFVNGYDLPRSEALLEVCRTTWKTFRLFVWEEPFLYDLLLNGYSVGWASTLAAE